MSTAAGPRLSVTLLGTGTSTGVPVIGCRCRVCTSADPRDTRTRCAAHVVAHDDAGPVHLQLDAGPDFRQQALAADLAAVDAVLVTHAHFDHVMGLDDLRPFFFNNPRPIPVFADPGAAETLRGMFAYVFRDGSYPGVSKLALREVGGEPFIVESREPDGARVEVIPVPAFHGRLPVLGYRVGRFAYVTDVSRIPEASFALLGGLDTLVVDGLRREPHETHFSLDEAAAAARRVGARQAYLLHMTHTVLHAEEDARLPDGVNLAYDGLTFEVGGD